MKTSIRQNNNRSIWKIKPISLSCLLMSTSLLLPVSSISIATKSAVAAVDCSAIQNGLNSLEKRLEALDNEPDLSTPQKKDEYIRKRKAVIQQISAKKAELAKCNNPPAAKPNLVVKNIEEVIDNSTSQRKYRAVIANNSDVPAPGPFEVTIGVTLNPNYAGGQTLSSEARDKASSSVTVAPRGEYRTKYNIVPNRFNTSYQVEIIVEYQGKLVSRLDKTFR
jgi:hypothetical protein